MPPEERSDMETVPVFSRLVVLPAPEDAAAPTVLLPAGTAAEAALRVLSPPAVTTPDETLRLRVCVETPDEVLLRVVEDIPTPRPVPEGEGASRAIELGEEGLRPLHSLRKGLYEG